MSAARLFSRAELADDFRALGVAAGNVVMLHASVRAVGPVAGGPDEIHLALMDASARTARWSCMPAVRATWTKSGAGI